MSKPDKREIKPIFVRLSEAERRRIRTLAVSQGLTMREAIVQAFEAWASQLQSGALTAGAKPKGGRQPERASMGQQLLRPADTTPSEVGPSAARTPTPSTKQSQLMWRPSSLEQDRSKPQM